MRHTLVSRSGGLIARLGLIAAALAAVAVLAAFAGQHDAADASVARRYVFPLSPSWIAHYTAGHSYPATDIFAPVGTRFVAVTSGVLESVNRADEYDPDVDDPSNRGGRWVGLLGDDGVRYYGSHLSVIARGLKPGDRVAAGQVLGYVGIAGDAWDTPSHLHFGISCPSTPDDWEHRRGEYWPKAYLDDWRAGIMTSPADQVVCAPPDGG